MRDQVDLVRRIYDAWDREESARDFISPDIEYVNPAYAVRFRWFQSHREALESAGLDPSA